MQLLWRHSTLPRVSGCRRRRIDSTDPSIRLREGVAHFAGLQHCGSIWSCAVCGAKIRQERAEEINAALLRHVGYPTHWGTGPRRARVCPIDERELARPGSVGLCTLTGPHDAGDPLEETQRAIAAGFHAVIAGRAWLEDCATFGIVGYIRAHDHTHGRNGWHPHLHVILLFSRELTPLEENRLRRRIYVRWARAYVGARPKLGRRGDAWEPTRRVPSVAHGVHLERARSVRDLARYAADVAGQETTPAEARERMVIRDRTQLALELTRVDLKTGQAREDGARPSRTAWEILRDIHSAPEADADGVVNEDRERDLQLWREFEQTTHGKQAIRWSAGLKAILGISERTDEEISDEEVGGELIHQFTTLEWWAVCGTRGAPARVLELAEDGGAESVAEYLSRIVPEWQERRARDRVLEQHPELRRRRLRRGPLAELEAAS